ncbi:MAG: HAMP domain-containing histidine kinase [Clostridia bacterium]|nr:HAMP domain-containing histidine kinase [Clostridia bacterium]
MSKPRRPKFRSIFAKYMSLFSVFVVSCILLLGVAQIALSANFWGREQKKNLTEDSNLLAITISKQVERNAIGGYSIRLDESSMLPELIRTISVTSDVDLMVANVEGGILIRSVGCATNGDTVPMAEMQKVAAGGDGHYLVGTLGGLFSDRRYVAVSPIIHGQIPVGYVFVMASAASFGAYIGDQLQVYLVAAFIALLLVFICSYVVAYRLVRPLRQMAAVTKKFGEGDFSGRLTVRGDDEVAQLAQSLNEMAVSLASVEGMSRSFVANVSHELKTPMTTISGFIDGILDGTIPPEKERHYLRIVSDEIRRLSRLVNAMLNLSRIDNGTLAFRPVEFDFAELVCKTALSFEQRVEQKRLQIEGLEACCTPLPLVGDFDLLGQVVYNLLDNAIKFADEGGTVRMGLRVENGRAWFSIRNTGGGVPADELPHLFERFYKSDKSRSVDKTGVGLGLYIVQHVIQLHGGEITVQSDAESYTEFAFWLPIKQNL